MDKEKKKHAPVELGLRAQFGLQAGNMPRQGMEDLKRDLFCP